MKEMVRSLWGVSGMLVLLLLIIGGMYFGLFTPSEAGAAGAFGAFLIMAFKRRLTLRTFYECLKDSAITTAYIMTIYIGAVVFTTFLVHGGFQAMISRWIVGLDISPIWVIVVMIIVYLIMGMFMDSMAMLLLSVPIFYPVVTGLGYDPIWFGVIVVMLIEAGMISPPVGINCFVLHSMFPEYPLKTVFWGVIPFFFVIILAVALIVAFPQIAIWLPARI